MLSALWFRMLLIGLCIVFVIYEAGQSRNDMDIFLAASKLLFSDGDIYAEKHFGIYHYFYSVFFATAIHPLVYLPIFFTRVLWVSAGILMIWRIIVLLLRFIDEDTWASIGKSFVVVVLLLFSLRLIRSNLHLGQINHWLLWLSLESIWLIIRGKKMWGGMVLAFAINIKLLPLVLIPYLIYRREFVAAASGIIGLILLYVIPGWWIGWGRNWLLLESYWHLIDPMQARHVFDHEETSFHSLTTLISTFFMENVREHNGLDLRRNILSLDATTIRHLILIVRLVFVFLTLRFLNTGPLVTFRGSNQTLYELSYLFLAAPLIFPHQQHYAFIWAMPAFFWLIVRYAEMKASVKKLIPFLLVYVCFNLALWNGGLNPWLNHFKILTWGALALLFLLIRTTPDSVNEAMEGISDQAR
jgi:hypothetical protein